MPDCKASQQRFAVNEWLLALCDYSSIALLTFVGADTWQYLEEGCVSTRRYRYQTIPANSTPLF
jgi:hypothetical protein